MTYTPPPALPRSSSASAAAHVAHPWPEHAGPTRPLAASFASARVRGSSAGGSTTGLSSDMDSGHFSDFYPQPPQRRGPRRNVALSDRRLVAVANETAAMIQWDRILRAPEPRLARWRWLEEYGGFALYTRHEAQRYAVLAIGIVPASVAELAALLRSRGPEQHVQRMEALFGDQFKHGAHVHDVDLSNTAALPPLTLASDAADPSVLTQLSVKTATFNRPNVLSSHEQWCFVDAEYTTGDIFEKHMTTLRAKDVLTGKSSSKTKDFRDVISGFCVQPELPETAAAAEEAEDHADVKATAVAASRVHFYAELFTPKSFGFSVPGSTAVLSERAIRHRLVRLAQSCARLPQLVRRRRLGVQVLVDSNRLLPPTNVACVRCDKHLLFAKQCRLCGRGVCDDCSAKYERERAVRGSSRLRIESIRVCDLCMCRVDAADYAHLGDNSDAALAPARVQPDPTNAKPATAVLTSLLQDALMNATSAEQKASVMNVIKCVLDQENGGSRKASSVDEGKPAAPVVLTDASSEKDYVRALVHFEVPTVPHTEASVAETAGRAYAVDPTAPTEQQMAFPVPEYEEQRLQAIKDTHIRELGRSEELNLICQMASREMDCFATLVTIVDQEELYVAASNIPTLEHQTFARNDSFCSHTIMSQNPLIIPHPEADVRFHQCLPVKMLGTKYYCGFPVTAGDAIIGAMCCVDVKSRELSESQYTYLTKLADTAGKLVTLHAEQRARGLSTVQDGAEPQPEPTAVAAA